MLPVEALRRDYPESCGPVIRFGGRSGAQATPTASILAGGDPAQLMDFDHESALKACAEGRQEGLRWIYDREASPLLGLCLRILRRRDLAEDVLHDAFMEIWRHAGRFDAGRGAARGWIYTVVRYRALNAARTLGREDAWDETDAEELEIEDSENMVDQISDRLRMKHCLEQLDAPRRRSVLLSVIWGLTHNEIARRLEEPLGTVKSRIRSALKALGDCLA